MAWIARCLPRDGRNGFINFNVKWGELMNSRALLCVAPWLIAAGTSTPVLAQSSLAQPGQPAAGVPDALEEVVVTAERRSEDLQKAAVSVSVKDGAEMIGEGRLSLGDYLSDIPGVSGTPITTSVYNPYANITIRGVISNSPGDGSQVPTTAVYTDGIYQGIGANYDMERVEVLRGPQGTLYGRSATGGVIATSSRDPKFDRISGDVAGVFGSNDLHNVQAGLNLPLGDELAFRVSGLSNDQDDYLSGYTSSQRAGRLKMLYKPADNLSILAGVASQYDRIEGGGPSYQLLTPDTPTLVGTNPHTVNKDHVWQYWADVNWDLGFGNLTYIPSYRRSYYDPIDSYVGPATGPVGYNPSITPLDSYLTHELRLASDAGSRFKWIVGAFYYRSVWENQAYLQWIASGALAFSSNQRKDSRDVGLFGETTFDLSDSLRLTTGLRFDYNSSRHTEVYANNLTHGPGGPPSPTFGLPEDLAYFTLDDQAGYRQHRNVTYKLRLEKDLDSTSLVYASVSSGFLPGDVQVSSLADGTPYANPYDQETLTAFEVGSKNRFLDDRLQVNGAAYYYDYSGYQVDVQPTPGVPGSAHITMTSAARMLGADLETLYLLTRNDQLSLTVGALDARFHDSPADFSVYVQQQRFTGIAPLTMSAAYEHTFPFGNGSALKARVDGQFSSAYDLLAINTLYLLAPAEQAQYVHLGSQTIGNASLNWSSPSGRYLLGGYVRNFADNVYKTALNIQYNGTVTASPSIGRTLGVTLRASF